jgi:hypothetical protein
LGVREATAVEFCGLVGLVGARGKAVGLLRLLVSPREASRLSGCSPAVAGGEGVLAGFLTERAGLLEPCRALNFFLFFGI